MHAEVRMQCAGQAAKRVPRELRAHHVQYATHGQGPAGANREQAAGRLTERPRAAGCMALALSPATCQPFL